MTIYSSKTLRSLPLTTTLSLLLFLVCRSFAIAPPPPPPPPPPPSVVVTTGDPGDPDPGDTKSCDVSAEVDNPPDPGRETTLIPHWTWSVGTVTVHPYDGGPDVTADPGDFSVSLKPIHDPGKPDDGTIDYTNPAATFTGTFRLTGYYAVPVIATVAYYYKDSGKYYGTYSGSDFVGDREDNPDYDPTKDTSGTSAPAPAMTSNSAAAQSQAPTGAPDPAPKLQKYVASGIFATLPNPVKLGLYSKNHATETYTIPIQPKSLFGDVKFDIPSGVASVSPKPETTTNARGQTVNTGRLILTFKALKPTIPTSPLPGDAIIATRIKNGKGVGEGTVLVLAPNSRTSLYHPMTLTYTNVYFGPGIQPTGIFSGDAPAPAKQAWFDTIASNFVTISFYDQFGALLDSLFDGTPVLEKQTTVKGSTGQQQIATLSGGQIQDPSVTVAGSRQDSDPNDPVQSTDEANWKSFNLPLPDKSPSHKEWTNAFAIHPENVQSITYTDSIGPVAVPPDETRTFTPTQTDDHSVGSSLLTVTHKP